MYAVTFDFDTASCERLYPGSDWRNAYHDIRRVLEAHGFWNQQGSVYFSNHRKVSAVILAVQDVQAKHPWFREVLRDLRMLRIEDNDNLLPILGRPELPLEAAGAKRRSSSSAVLN